MAIKNRGRSPRQQALLKQARQNLISRTARVWSKLGRSLVSDLKGISQPWVERVLKAAMKNIEVGYLEDAPALPARFERELRDALNYAALQGFWLQHVYMKECEVAMEERLYHVPADDPMREALQKLTKYKIELSDEWTDVVPKAALEWLKGYTPKLAGKLEEDTLKKVNTVVAKAMEEGLPLKERMEALKAASPQIEKMADTRVEAIVRTEITRADNMGRLTEMTNNPDVIGVEFSAVLDGRTTVMCDHRHGLFMKIDDPRLPYNTPPLHVSCRSILVPATVFEHPDGLLTSHEFDDGDMPDGIQRPEDIEAVREVLGQNAKASDFAFVGNSLPDPEYEKVADLDPLSKNVKKINKYIEAWDRQAAEEVDAIYQTEIGQKIKELIDKGVHKEKEAVALGAMIQEAFHDGIVRHFELVQGVIDRDEFGKGKDKDLAAEIMLRETPNRFLLAALKKYRDIGGVEPVCMESSKDNKAAVELIKRAATYLPSDWVARALVSNGSNIEFHVELLEKGSRASATDTESGNEETNIVRVCAKGLSTAIHELVHIFEARVPAIGDVGMQHLKSRTKGEKPESIAVLLNDSNYSKTELTLKDKFLRIYMGRDYSTERNKAAYSDEHTEVMSMGIPALLFNHYDIWYKAPQPVAKEKKKIGKDGKVTTSFEWVRPELGEVKSSDEHHLRAALGVFFGTKAEAVAQPVRPAKPKKPTLSIRNLIVGKVPEQDEFAEIRGMLVEDIRANRQDAGHGEVNITADILKGFYKSAGIGQIDEDTKTKVGVKLSNEEAEARIKALTNYMGENRSKMWKAYEKDQQGKKLTKEEKGYLNDYKLVAEVVQVMPTFEKADNDPNELYLGIKAGDFARALKDSKEGMILNFGHIMTATSSLKEAEEYADGKEKTGVILHLKNEFYGDIVDFTSVKGITGKQDILIGDLYWQVTKTKEDKNTGKFHVYLTSATPGLTSGVGIPQDSSAMSPAPSSFDMASSPAQAKATELKLSKKIAEQDLAKAEKLRDAFKDAPDFIKNFYERYIDNLQDMKIDELHPLSGSYDNLQIAIAIGRGYYDDEQDFKKVIRHEMGHFFDQMIAHQRDLDAGKDKDDLSIRPVSTKDKDFIAAVTRAEKLCDTSDSGTEAIRAKMRELVHFGEMRSNKAVSDIFSAITHARDKTLYGEGYHSAEYYSKLSHVPHMEIFANLTALYASNDQKGIDFLLKNFPELFNDINNEYLKLMGGAGFKFEAAPAVVAKPKRKKKDAEPTTDTTLEVVKPKAKRAKAKITEVVPDVAVKEEPAVALVATKGIPLASLSPEKQKALKGIIVDEVPVDAYEDVIRNVSKELINKNRGALGHAKKDSITVEDVQAYYKNSDIDITLEEAKKVRNSVLLYTVGNYAKMHEMYRKHMRGEKLDEYDQEYLEHMLRVKEFASIAPRYQPPKKDIKNGVFELFRGLNGNSEYAESAKMLEPGMIYNTGQPVSTSSDMMSAEKFTGWGPHRTMLHFELDVKDPYWDAVSIRGISGKFKEKEVVLNTQYWEVVRVDRHDYDPLGASSQDTLTHIYLRPAKVAQAKKSVGETPKDAPVTELIPETKPVKKTTRTTKTPKAAKAKDAPVTDIATDATDAENKSKKSVFDGLTEEERWKLEGKIVDKVPADYRKETVRGVSREDIDKKRGSASHMVDLFSMTADVIKGYYDTAEVPISQAEAKATEEAIKRFTGGEYMAMRQAYEKGLKRKRLDKYTKGMRDDYERIIEFTKVAPTFKNLPSELNEPFERREAAYLGLQPGEVNVEARRELMKYLHRGVSGGGANEKIVESLKSLRVDMVYDSVYPMSTSSVMGNAEAFTGSSNGVMLHFAKAKDGDILDAVSVMGASHHPFEHEVLVADRYWRVTKIEPNAGDGNYHIFFERAKAEAAKAMTEVSVMPEPTLAQILAEDKSKAKRAGKEKITEAKDAPVTDIAPETETVEKKPKRTRVKKTEEEKLAEKALKEAERAAAKAQRDAERAAKRAEERAKKEAERAAAKAQRDAERAAKRAEEKAKKDAERAAKKAAKEAEKARKDAESADKPKATRSRKTTPKVTPVTTTPKDEPKPTVEVNPDKTVDTASKMQVAPVVEKLNPSESMNGKVKWLQKEVMAEDNISDKDVLVIEDNLSELFKSDTIHIGIRRKIKTLKAFLESRRNKTQFETDRSGGTLDKEKRARAEADMMGYPADMNPQDRPSYGMLFQFENLEDLKPTEYNGNHYGGVVLIFKQKIKEYATVTCGDSLACYEDSPSNIGDGQSLLPTPLLKFDSRSISPCMLKGLSEDIKAKKELTPTSIANTNKHSSYSIKYIEAQIHGGQATLDNLEAIVFSYDTPDRKIPKKLLKQMGIKWYKEEEPKRETVDLSPEEIERMIREEVERTRKEVEARRKDGGIEKWEEEVRQFRIKTERRLKEIERLFGLKS